MVHGRLAARQRNADRRAWVWKRRLEHVAANEHPFRSGRGVHRLPANPQLSVATPLASAAIIATIAPAAPAATIAPSISSTAGPTPAHNRMVSLRAGAELHRRVRRQRTDLRLR
jgi:hypothetical protein